jgi:hypothetical protein
MNASEELELKREESNVGDDANIWKLALKSSSDYELFIVEMSTSFQNKKLYKIHHNKSHDSFCDYRMLFSLLCCLRIL